MYKLHVAKGSWSTIIGNWSFSLVADDVAYTHITIAAQSPLLRNGDSLTWMLGSRSNT